MSITHSWLGLIKRTAPHGATTAELPGCSWGSLRDLSIGGISAGVCPFCVEAGGDQGEALQPPP